MRRKKDWYKVKTPVLRPTNKYEEVIYQPLYSQIQLEKGVNDYVFFQDVVGKHVKTKHGSACSKSKTNMDFPGYLPYPQRFLLTNISMSKDQLCDVSRLRHATITFVIGSKTYFTIPLSRALKGDDISTLIIPYAQNFAVTLLFDDCNLNIWLTCYLNGFLTRPTQ